MGVRWWAEFDLRSFIVYRVSWKTKKLDWYSNNGLARWPLVGLHRQWWKSPVCMKKEDDHFGMWARLVCLSFPALLGQESFYFVGHYWGLGISKWYFVELLLYWEKKCGLKLETTFNLLWKVMGLSMVFLFARGQFSSNPKKKKAPEDDLEVWFDGICVKSNLGGNTKNRNWSQIIAYFHTYLVIHDRIWLAHISQMCWLN